MKGGEVEEGVLPQAQCALEPVRESSSVFFLRSCIGLCRVYPAPLFSAPSWALGALGYKVVLDSR